MIIQLETKREEAYSYMLSDWLQEVIDSQDPKAIESIRSLWDGESWASIQRKFQVEGSTWYVWWMDGVRAYMRMDNGQTEGKEKAP